MRPRVCNVFWCLLIWQFFAVGAMAQAGAPWVGETFIGVQCTGGDQGYGPYDYLQRQSLAGKLQVVETHHFTPEVEQLQRGKSGSLATDLDYTLRAWPNHHRALNAMMRYQDSLQRIQIQRLSASGVPPVECYFQRAINFSSSDAITKMLFGMLLHKKDQLERAEREYRAAIDLAPGDRQIQYNLGLLLVDRGKYAEAKTIAETLYGEDFPLPGLQNKLRRKGQWP